MALTKKMLQAMDIPEDKIEQILDAHGESVNGLTAKRDELQEQLDKANEEVKRLANVEKDLAKANAKLEEADETAEKLKTLQVEYDKYKESAEAKEILVSKEKAYRKLLSDSGVSEKRLDSIIKVTDLNALEVDKDGSFKDSDKLAEQIKSEWADFIVTKSKQGAEVSNPPGSTGGSTFEKMSLAEKMTYANEHPDNAEVQAWLN